MSRDDNPYTPVLDWGAWATLFVFFTGKGGVGKTTIAAAAAVRLADTGHRVLLVSTDPASNLADVLAVPTSQEDPVPVAAVPGLDVLDLDPQAAAGAYRERVLAPYRGVLPAGELDAFTEQLAGACTVEVAAFDTFARLLADTAIRAHYDHVMFDTAPTGHTLRLLSLPAAWSGYLTEAPYGTSCLGPLAALDEQHATYEAAVAALADPALTTVVLVARADRGSLPRPPAPPANSPRSASHASSSSSTPSLPARCPATALPSRTHMRSARRSPRCPHGSPSCRRPSFRSPAPT